jgi:hypothetical protein
LTVGAGIDYEVGYDQTLSDKSHLLQMASVAYRAMRYAMQYMRRIRRIVFYARP